MSDLNLETPAPEADPPQTEPPAPEAGEQHSPEAEAGDSAAPEASTSEPPKAEPTDQHVKSGLQRRIDQLVYQAREAERQLEAERLERLKAEAQQAAISRIQQIDSQEPQPEAFDSTTDYLRAHSQWASRRALEIFDARAAINNAEGMARSMVEQRQRAEAQERAAHVAATIDQKMAKGAEKYPDFVKVLSNPALPSSLGSPLFDAVMNADHGVDIAYSLGKNPEKYVALLELSRQNPAAVYREVLKMDMQWSGASNKTSQAPPPPTELKGSPPDSKRPSEMTYEEFVKWRRRSIAARQSR